MKSPNQLVVDKGFFRWSK